MCVCVCIKLKSQSKSHIEAPRDSWRNKRTSLVRARNKKPMMMKWKKPNMSERVSVQMLYRTCLIQLPNHTIGNEWVRVKWNASMSKRVFIFILFFFIFFLSCWLLVADHFVGGAAAVSFAFLNVHVVFRSFVRSFVLCAVVFDAIIIFWCVSLFHPTLKSFSA